jgi:UPF0755 protein
MPAAERTPKKPPPSRRKKRAPRAQRKDAPTRVGLSPRGRAIAWGAGALLATIALAVLGLLLAYGRSGGASGRVVEVDWPAGLTSEQAAARLAELGLVESRDTMAVFLRATGGTEDFVPGPHVLFEGATPWELRRMLSRSILRPAARISIPEGWNRFDIAARLEKRHIAGREAFLRASADPRLLAELGVAPPGWSGVESAEGYLFPATYDFGKDTDPRDVVRRLVGESNRRWRALSEKHAESFTRLREKLGWSRREIVVVASMIEKEAAVDSDRALIASVFVNRLSDPDFKPKRLQSDPTSSYGCIAFPAEAPSCAGFAGKPTPAINRDPNNRYSTYAHTGLPPGPIANPGAKSLEAALAPAETRYFYFVASGGGKHAFSETFGAHHDAVRRPRDAGAP